MNNEDLNNIAVLAHKTAKDKGFWDNERDINELLMLVITELSEAVEADRKGRMANIKYYSDRLDEFRYSANQSLLGDEIPSKFEEYKKKSFERYIKDTFEDEIADAILRVMDLMASLNIRASETGEMMTIKKGLNKYKNNTAASILYLTHSIVEAGNLREQGEHILFEDQINVALHLLVYFAEERGIDIQYHLLEKLRYNSQREKLHGKLY
jgi:NTP pyrophosphatase (non-canonical NTP hydrolase)